MKLRLLFLAMCCLVLLTGCREPIPTSTDQRSGDSSVVTSAPDAGTSSSWYAKVAVAPATAALVSQSAEQDAVITDVVRDHARRNASTVMAERLGVSPETAAGLEFIVGEPLRFFTLDARADGGLFDAMVPSDVYRVPIVAGSERAEEYDLRRQESGTWMAFTDDARFLGAVDAALYLLWEGMDESRFRYRLLWESEEGVWIVATDGDRVAGVFLGRCMEGTADVTAFSTPAEPGKLYVGSRLEDLVRSRVAEAPSGQ